MTEDVCEAIDDSALTCDRPTINQFRHRLQLHPLIFLLPHSLSTTSQTKETPDQTSRSIDKTNKDPSQQPVNLSIQI